MYAPVEMETDQIVLGGVQNDGCGVAEVLDNIFYDEGEGFFVGIGYSLFAYIPVLTKTLILSLS
jgi:hypothetical protein